MENKPRFSFGFIDVEELENKEIVIWGTEAAARLLVYALDVPYKLMYYCDNRQNTWGGVIDGVKILSPDELREYLRGHEECIVAIASVGYTKIVPQIREYGIKNRIISWEAIVSPALEHKARARDGKWDVDMNKEIMEAIESNRFGKIDFDFPVLYAAPKVGNTSFNASIGEKANYKHLHGLDYSFMDESEKNIFRSRARKIVIGVRDAIAQNISLVYENSAYYNCLALGKDGDDMQKAFDYFIDDSICREQERRKERTYGYEKCQRVPMLMQSWFDDEFLKELNIDIYQFPFDCEKGCTIYKNIDGRDIMIYQLEKMSGLTEVFRDFTGNRKFEIKRENDASGKFYSDGYRYFKENVEMSEEYLEKTYNGKMMRHFYSDKDIARFRSRWEKHIRSK